MYRWEYKNAGDESGLSAWGSNCTVKSTDSTVYSKTGKALYTGRSNSDFDCGCISNISMLSTVEGWGQK